MTEQNVLLYYKGVGQTWSPTNPRKSEGQLLIREFRREVLQMKASVVPPNLTRNLEALIESQKIEIQSLQRDVQSTQDSLNRTLIRFKVSVLMKLLLDGYHPSADFTEPAISHLPQSGGEPELRIQCREQHQTWLQLPGRYQRASGKLQWQ